MTNKTLTAGVAASALLGGFAALIIAIVWAGAWAGLTLSVLWGWFVVPLFGVPALSVAQAYGLGLVVRAASGLKDPDSKDKGGFGLAIARMVLLPPFICGLFLLFGWVARAWV